MTILYGLDLASTERGAASDATAYRQASDLDVLGAAVELGIGGLLGGLGGELVCSFTSADDYLGRALGTDPENVRYAFRGGGTAIGVGAAAYDMYRKRG